MTAFLTEPVTTIALCWRIERTDGVTIGLTDHDRDLTIGGIIYSAAPGMTPSAVERDDGLEADSMDVAGAFSNRAITAADLAAGRWDAARVSLFAADWTGADGQTVPLGTGTIGTVETSDGRFAAELAGAAALIDRPAAPETSPDCRALLGDRACRVPMAGRRRIATVISCEDAAVQVSVTEPAPNGWGDGLLRWITGANSGLENAVAASDGDMLTLRTAPVLPVVAGDMIELTEGCDKQFATCRDRFGNAANFRGEPHLPGIDLLTRYPGG